MGPSLHAAPHWHIAQVGSRRTASAKAALAALWAKAWASCMPLSKKACASGFVATIGKPPSPYPGISSVFATTRLVSSPQIATPASSTDSGGVTAPSPRGFRLLLGIGAIDNAARSGFLTFLPFLLQAKGASLTTIALALSLVLAGGAAGKLVCGYLGARLGVLTTVLLTEGSTAAGMVALLALPLDVVLIVLPLVGIALNGTSSVLYGTVPELVPPDACARAFGIFYTGTIAASALAPPVLGLFADRLGVSNAIVGIALAVLLTIPLAVALNPLLPREV